MLHHPVVVSQNVGCFLRLSFEELAQSLVKHVNEHNLGIFQTETYTPGNHHGWCWCLDLPVTLYIHLCSSLCGRHQKGEGRGGEGRGSKVGKGKPSLPKPSPFVTCLLCLRIANSTKTKQTFMTATSTSQSTKIYLQNNHSTHSDYVYPWIYPHG